MNSGILFPTLAAALLALPAVAWADRNPDFENDALPILRHQPGLARYVHAHYVVQETGVAQVPGTGSEPPRPPYIFSAKPRGASGPFYLRLLIQPGPAGHILKVADIRSLPGGEPPQETVPGEVGTAAPAESAPMPPTAEQPASNPASAEDNTPPASSSQPTFTTPSGPIRD
jgi:hypothetical protein